MAPLHRNRDVATIGRHIHLLVSCLAAPRDAHGGGEGIQRCSGAVSSTAHAHGRCLQPQAHFLVAELLLRGNDNVVYDELRDAMRANLQAQDEAAAEAAAISATVAIEMSAAELAELEQLRHEAALRIQTIHRGKRGRASVEQKRRRGPSVSSRRRSVASHSGRAM